MPPILFNPSQTQVKFNPSDSKIIAGTASPSFELSTQTSPAQLHFYQVPESLLPKIKEVQTRINEYLKSTYRKMLADFEADRAENEAIKHDALIYAVTVIANVMEWHAENLARFKMWRNEEVAKAQQAEAIWREAAESAWAENQALREALERIGKAKTIGEVRGMVNQFLGNPAEANSNGAKAKG